MSTPIHDVLLARAQDMATQDGASIGAVHIIGAANLLQADLIAARDRLLTGTRRPVPSTVLAIDPAPQADPLPPSEPDDGSSASETPPVAEDAVETADDEATS